MQPARIGRIAAQVALAVVVAVAIVVAIVYGLSEYRLRRSHDVPLEAVAVPAGPEALALGRRRAISLGCFDGCHGLDALGGQWLDEPRLALITAPNLTELAERGERLGCRSSPMSRGAESNPSLIRWKREPSVLPSRLPSAWDCILTLRRSEKSSAWSASSSRKHATPSVTIPSTGRIGDYTIVCTACTGK